MCRSRCFFPGTLLFSKHRNTRALYGHSQASEQQKSPHQTRHFALSGAGFRGTPEGTRTPDLQVRNLTFYPTELRALTQIIAECAPRCKHVAGCLTPGWMRATGPGGLQ